MSLQYSAAFLTRSRLLSSALSALTSRCWLVSADARERELELRFRCLAGFGNRGGAVGSPGCCQQRTPASLTLRVHKGPVPFSVLARQRAMPTVCARILNVATPAAGAERLRGISAAAGWIFLESDRRRPSFGPEGHIRNACRPCGLETVGPADIPTRLAQKARQFEADALDTGACSVLDRVHDQFTCLAGGHRPQPSHRPAKLTRLTRRVSDLLLGVAPQRPPRPSTSPLRLGTAVPIQRRIGGALRPAHRREHRMPWLGWCRCRAEAACAVVMWPPSPTTQRSAATPPC